MHGLDRSGHSFERVESNAERDEKKEKPGEKRSLKRRGGRAGLEKAVWIDIDLHADIGWHLYPRQPLAQHRLQINLPPRL